MANLYPHDYGNSMKFVYIDISYHPSINGVFFHRKNRHFWIPMAWPRLGPETFSPGEEGQACAHHRQPK